MVLTAATAEMRSLMAGTFISTDQLQTLGARYTLTYLVAEKVLYFIFQNFHDSTFDALLQAQNRVPLRKVTALLSNHTLSVCRPF